MRNSNQMNHPNLPRSAISPLAFTLAYQQYRSEASRNPFADTRLLTAARFWRANEAALHSPAYATYRLEDIPPVLDALNPDQLDDLRPSELEEVARFVERAGLVVSYSPPKDPPTSDSDDVGATQSSKSAKIWDHAARKWLYIGEASNAVDALLRGGLPFVIATDELASILADCSASDATEIPGIIATQVESSHPALAHWLRAFEAAWKTQREGGDANRAQCVLVEYDANGLPVRGRLRLLEGKVETLKRDAESDEVIFHHQVKSPDDPFVGTVYAAFEALRSLTFSSQRRRLSIGSNPDPVAGPCHPEERSDEGSAVRPRPNERPYRNKADPRYRGRFTFNRDGVEMYSGDSIGLSAFAVAFGDQWSHEVRAERRLIGQTVAFTGGIGPNGSLQPISADSLALKVERAFHSPITHLVVPESNRKAVEGAAELLREAHPRRRLHIIAVERPPDIIADKNIFHAEKLWPGEFVVRKAARYSRSVKVQVPVLVVLGYLLLSLIYPKAWIGFDREPRSLRLTGHGFVAQNSDGDRLWEKEFDCDCDTTKSLWTVGDLDADGHAEVAYLLNNSEQRLCDLIGTLFVYDHNGMERFRRRCCIKNEYPGDTVFPQQYTMSGLSMIRMRGRPLIMTCVVNSYPARSHIRFWTARGDSLGWYINAGYAAGNGLWVISPERDVLYGTGINNRVASACLFAISADSSYGASPPYTDSTLDLSKVHRGNQLHYLIFPQTPLCRVRAIYNGVFGIFAEAGGVIRVDVDEFGGQRNTGDSTAPVSYYLNLDCQLLRVRCTDNFIAAWNNRVARGELSAVDWSTYTDQLMGNVTHWTDSGWVTESQLRAVTVR